MDVDVPLSSRTYYGMSTVVTELLGNSRRLSEAASYFERQIRFYWSLAPEIDIGRWMDGWIDGWAIVAKGRSVLGI